MKDFFPKTELGKLLYQNEMKYLASLSNGNAIRTSAFRKRMFCSFSFDGDLVDWVLKKKTTSAFDDVDKQLALHGFQTAKEITERYKADHLGSLKRISLNSLIIGVKYSLWDISALAKNFNQMLGMYASHDQIGNPVAIVKATINENSSRKHIYNYADQWTGTNHDQMKYFLQKENNVDDFAFKNETNRLIFDGLIIGVPVPIYVFFNEEKKVDYQYAGIFNANDISSDRQSFDICRSTLFNEQSIETNRHQFLKDYLGKLPEVWETKLMKEVTPPSHFENQKRFEYSDSISKSKSNADYIELEEVRKIIGDLGEREVIQYEKWRLNQIKPELANKVAKADLDSDGFDIRSFDVNGPEIKDIKIEVKTTSSPIKGEPFFMSENERRTMVTYPNNYWLYRLFDAHSRNIRFFALKDNVESKLKLDPVDYKVTFK